MGLALLSVFFALGATIASLVALALLFPGGWLDPIWRLNPEAHTRLSGTGPWAIALMSTVAVACALAARGLWIRARWGRRLALAVLAVNLLGDTANALLRHDLRTLIGFPIGGALIAYLLSPGVKKAFTPPQNAGSS